MKRLFFFILLLHGSGMAAQEVCDSVKIHFRQGRIELDMGLSDNRAALRRITDSLQTGYADSVYSLKKVTVVGGASPEGSIRFNQWLSRKRAGVLFEYISQYSPLPDSVRTFEFLGRDWNGLIRMVEADPAVPYRDETLRVLRSIADETARGTSTGADPLHRIQRLRGGVPYKYMYRTMFPELRASQLRLWYERVQNPLKPVAPPRDTIYLRDTVYIHDTLYVCPPCRPFYMAVKTNMLYDLLAVPNIGIELYLGGGWSVVANWMYGWWNSDSRHRYWRIYGGDIALRRWFGAEAGRKPLTGHHLGIYAQTLTYDFEWGGRGYMGGEPGGSLWDRASWGAGLEYGYSLPVARRWNIDFTLGVGYLGGRYHEYVPQDGCYVWQCSKDRHWFGPTKAEVSLTWLIGCDNYNRKKGGKR